MNPNLSFAREEECLLGTPNEFSSFKSILQAPVVNQTGGNLSFKLNQPGETDGTFHLKTHMNFSPATKERLDEVSAAFKNLTVLNEVGDLLGAKKSFPMNYAKMTWTEKDKKITATTATATSSKYTWNTSGYLQGFEWVTARKSTLDCNDIKSNTAWVQVCAPNFNAKDQTSEFFGKGTSAKTNCRIVQNSHISCDINFDGIGQKIPVPYLAQYFLGTKFYSPSQAAYLTAESSLESVFSIREYLMQSKKPRKSSGAVTSYLGSVQKSTGMAGLMKSNPASNTTIAKADYSYTWK